MQLSPSTRLTLFLLAASVTLPQLGWGQSKALSLEEIVKRVQQADADSRDHSVSYTVTREYELSAAGAEQPASDVVAQVTYFPPAQKDYAIVKSQGSDRGESIVRKVLENEARMASHAELHQIGPANYNFALAGRDSVDGHDCYVLQLSPKRDAVELLRGKAWVDADTFVVRRIAGATAKSPSLWIKNLNVSVTYGQLNGVWVQTSTRAEADVRFAGPHVLTSKDIDLQTASVNARNRTSARVPASRPRTSVGDAATWVAR